MAHEQHRTAIWLMLNTVTAAAAGLGFWLMLTRALHVPARDIGIGYAVVAIATTAALLAKGGFDTALVRLVPAASRQDADRLLRQATLAAVGLAVLLCCAALALPMDGLTGWERWLAGALAAALAVLLVVTWLQDAFFLAEGQARQSVKRNLAASFARMLIPIPLVFWHIPQAVAASWVLALAVAATLGTLALRRMPKRGGGPVPPRALRRSAVRNLAGSAAEFLPGLILGPIVLATRGADEAAYFGMAWTAASLLFLASAAMSRSALAHLVRGPGTLDGAELAACLRRAALQHLALVVPGAFLAAVLAPWLLGVFGPVYAAQGALPLRVLAMSALVVSPAYLYLAVLRARDRALPLTVFPAAMILALVLLAPLLAARYGLPGVALAWLVANIPFGSWAALNLARLAKGVMPVGPQPVRGRAHLE